MKQLILLILTLAVIFASANNIRGNQDGKTQRELAFRRRYPRRRRSRDPVVYLVNDERRRRYRNFRWTRANRCANSLEAKLDYCVDVKKTNTESDASVYDYVYFLDATTDCNKVKRTIEEDLGCTSGWRRYKDYRGYRRYRYDRNKRWNRYHHPKDDKKSTKKSRKQNQRDSDSNTGNNKKNGRWGKGTEGRNQNQYEEESDNSTNND
eukprot:scaffold3240_cov197-Alexandrium_tamarense.AAC.24